MFSFLANTNALLFIFLQSWFLYRFFVGNLRLSCMIRKFEGKWTNDTNKMYENCIITPYFVNFLFFEHCQSESRVNRVSYWPSQGNGEVFQSIIECVERDVINYSSTSSSLSLFNDNFIFTEMWNLAPRAVRLLVNDLTILSAYADLLISKWLNVDLSPVF